MIEFVSSDYPDSSGIYMMKDGGGRIIYVGKAKSLRKRLAQYFVAMDRLTPKTQALVSKIAFIDTLLTATEKEALLLEESLIKKHRPRYNIVLKDDKKYVLFKLDKGSAFPRLVMTRKVSRRKGDVYFGPFTSAVAARETWKLIGKVFALRKCTDRVMANRVRPCLYHHMKQCLAPCTEYIDRQDYMAIVSKVEMLLTGRSHELSDSLKNQMETASEALDFERAAVYRDQLQAVAKTIEQQTTVLPNPVDMDVMAVAAVSGGLVLGILFVRQGRLVGHKGYHWNGLGIEEGPELFQTVISQFYTSQKLIPPRILIPWELDVSPHEALLSERRDGRVQIRPPAGSTEKKLLELAARNAKNEASAKAEVDVPGALQHALGLRNRPHRIECVDISHLGGQGTRAGVVVFVDGRPEKNSYRAYALEEVEGTSDDYAAMMAFTARRVLSDEPMPDLLLIDGGRGQLSVVERALSDAGCTECVELASIAKASRKKGELGDVIFRPGRKNPLKMTNGSPELLLLQRMRDAAHDFVLGRQRQTRKSALKSELTALDGIGPATAKILWDNYSSLQEMAAATTGELASLQGIGKKKAESIWKSLRKFSQ